MDALDEEVEDGADGHDDGPAEVRLHRSELLDSVEGGNVAVFRLVRLFLRNFLLLSQLLLVLLVKGPNPEVTMQWLAVLEWLNIFFPLQLDFFRFFDCSGGCFAGSYCTSSVIFLVVDLLLGLAFDHVYYAILLI